MLEFCLAEASKGLVHAVTSVVCVHMCSAVLCQEKKLFPFSHPSLLPLTGFLPPHPLGGWGII